jgi:hypothetical protein
LALRLSQAHLTSSAVNHRLPQPVNPDASLFLFDALDNDADDQHAYVVLDDYFDNGGPLHGVLSDVLLENIVDYNRYCHDHSRGKSSFVGGNGHS